MNSKRMFGLNIYSGTMSSLLEELELWLDIEHRYAVVCTPNTDHIVRLEGSDRSFKNTYNQADWIIPDGMPLIWASKILGKPLKERIAGSDLLPLLLNLANTKGLKVAAICANEDIAESFDLYKNVHLPNIDLKCYVAPRDFDKNDEYQLSVSNLISNFHPTIVLVGLGFPKQEKWLFNYGGRTGAKLGIGIGASLEFLTGEKKRSPMWMRKVGLEWLHRAITDRRLIKRYIKDFIFFPLVIKELVNR